MPQQIIVPNANKALLLVLVVLVTSSFGVNVCGSPSTSTSTELGNHSQSPPVQSSLVDFFAVPNNDGLLVKWAHAVGSLSELHQALNDSTVHMLQCDVSLDLDGLAVVSARNSTAEASLSVEELLRTLVRSTLRKGVKLHFRNDSALLTTLELLAQQFRHVLKAPLVLQFDVLTGPGGSPAAVLNGTRLVHLWRTHFVQASLSLGWSTGNGNAVDDVKIMLCHVPRQCTPFAWFA